MKHFALGNDWWGVDFTSSWGEKTLWLLECYVSDTETMIGGGIGLLGLSVHLFYKKS